MTEFEGKVLADLSVLKCQMSEVESPDGKRISWARAGPSGSLPKSTWKRSFSFMPPAGLQSICSM